MERVTAGSDARGNSLHWQDASATLADLSESPWRKTIFEIRRRIARFVARFFGRFAIGYIGRCALRTPRSPPALCDRSVCPLGNIACPNSRPSPGWANARAKGAKANRGKPETQSVQPQASAKKGGRSKRKSLGVTRKPIASRGSFRSTARERSWEPGAGSQEPVTKDQGQMTKDQLLTSLLTFAPELTPDVINAIESPPRTTQPSNRSRTSNYDNALRQALAGKVVRS